MVAYDACLSPIYGFVWKYFVPRKVVDNSTSEKNRRPFSSSAERRRKSSRRHQSQSPATTAVSSLYNATILRRRSSSNNSDLADQYRKPYRNQNDEVWVKKAANRNNIRSGYGKMIKFEKNDQPPNYCQNVSVRQQFLVDDTETESEFKFNNNGITLPGCRSRKNKISEDERIFTHDELKSKRANMEAYV
uniref:Uncharacterized protein n=1 Tax=Romanomermis culicivorax TaxID=13658 RepID=A0A915JGX4_ROMCU